MGPPGGVEAVFSVLALHTGYVPGTINYETPDPECDLNCMTDGAKKLDPQYALSNSFGFGGTNGSILVQEIHGVTPFQGNHAVASLNSHRSVQWTTFFLKIPNWHALSCWKAIGR